MGLLGILGLILVVVGFLGLFGLIGTTLPIEVAIIALGIIMIVVDRRNTLRL